MSKINLAIIGSSGRMGKEIIKLVKADDSFLLKAEVFRSGPIKSLDKIDQKIDVAIDFSLVENFKNTLDWCVSKNIKLVSGVTGLGSDEVNALNLASEKNPMSMVAQYELGH